MIKGRFTQILKILKIWLLRLARHSARLFYGFFSSLHLATGHLKLSTSDKRFITRFLGETPPRSQRGIAGEDVPIFPSLLPPGEMGREVTGELPSLSDDPYTELHSRSLQNGTVMPPLATNATTTGYSSATETDGLHQGSMSSLHLSPQIGESSGNNTTPFEDPLQESNSPGPSRIAGPHETSRTHSRSYGYTDSDGAHSVNTITRPPSMSHLTPGVPYSQYASVSRVSVSTGDSLTRSIAGSESRQAAYRTHKGPVPSRPISVHSSIADVHHRSPSTVSIPLGLPSQGVPVTVTDPGFDYHVHYTAPPGGNEQPGPEVVIYDGPLIAPMAASQIRRYDRMVSRDPDVNNIIIPAMTITFPAHDMTVPQGWTTVVHPEGPRYFMNEETRTFTEMNICDPDIGDDIEYYMRFLLDELQQVVENGSLVLDMKQVDLVVEPKVYGDGSVVGCYCFVNHRDRCLFWLDGFNSEHIISGCKGVESLSHIRLAIQVEYWRYWDVFPSLCQVTQNLVDEVKDMLIQATCDHLTSDQSCAPFDAIELRDYLSVVDRIKVYPLADQGMQRGHAAIVIGRIMYTFSRNHFLNYYGENCVRLIADQTVHGWSYKRSSLMVILAPVLFFDSLTQANELHRIFVDEVAYTRRWNAFTSKFNGQLQDSNLLATVLLNANVDFLAINSVDVGGRNAIQMANYMSLVASMGSMIVGLLLVSHNRSKSQDTQLRTATFLSGLHDRKHGLEKLGIIYSLPKALLIWGMVFFFAAFSVNWWSPGDDISRVVVGTVVLVVFVTILCSIVITRESGWIGPLHGRVLLSRLADALKQVMEFMKIQRDLTRNPRFYSEGIGLTPVGLTQSNGEVDAPTQGTSSPSTTSPGFQPEIPGLVDHDNHPNSAIPLIRLYHASVSIDPPQQPHNNNSVLPSSNSSTSSGILSGATSLQQNQEDIQTVLQDQSTIDARCDHDSASLGMHLNVSPSEGMVGTAANATLHSDALPITVTILSEHSRPQEDDHQAGH